MSLPGVSAVVITWNEEKNIGRCLSSLRWVDELIVVDSFSTDRTVEIARAYTSSVFQHVFDGDIAQRERGFASARHTWLLYIDADEEVSDELQAEIRTIVRRDVGPLGYYLPRRVYALGRWIRHGGWSPDYTLRLFHRDHVIPERAEVHGGFRVSGPTARLRGPLYHYTYSSIDEYIAKMNDYTSLQVIPKLSGSGNRLPRVVRLFFSPFSHFMRKYISNGGYHDGMHGFVLAALGALYTLALYAKVWEYMTAKNAARFPLPPATNVEVQRLKRPGFSATGDQR